MSFKNKDKVKRRRRRKYTGNGLGAGRAPFRKELSKAFSAVWFLVLGSKALAGKRLVTVGASKALTMPRVVLVSHTSSSDNLST